MSIPDALDLEAHRAQIALDLAQNESRIRPMATTHPAPFPPDFYTKTLTNITNLRQEYEHNDTLHRFLGDAEAAIANLIVLNDETKKERDDALNSARRTVNDLDASITLGRLSLESLPDAAARIVRERDSARSALATSEASWKIARNDLRAAFVHLEAERETVRNWSTRYEALFAQSAHLAREVDRLKNEKADRVEAKPSTGPIKVGDRVVSAGECATVIGFFTSIAGVEFLAVETMLRGGLGRPYFWRRDLCNPAQVST